MNATNAMKKKQHTIADVLHYAADNCLVSRSQSSGGFGKEKFSCCAVYTAIYRMTGGSDSVSLKYRVMAGLEAMVCDGMSNTLFREYGDPMYYEETLESVQGMRYMWLKWAALMAEEQGV